jgi:aerobic-type carbon monoxide dehydrogenase small subunit (CoxS/CutS family)
MNQDSRETVVSVNDTEHRVKVPGDMKLLEFLRETLGLNGTKCGCGYGACGACTVLLDGAPVRSCLTRVLNTVGKRIQTIEGIAQAGQLDPVQKAFLKHGAFQCGFCTPGMILEVCGFLATLDGRIPEQDEVKDSLHRHICRCGSYQRIVAAVIDVATQQAGSTVR